MRMKKAALSVIAFVLFACCVAMPVSAMTKEEALAGRNRLQQELIAINTRLAQINDDVTKAQAQADTLADRIYIVEQQIVLIQTAIQATQDELVLLQQQLDQARLQMQQTFALFEDRIREMYTSGDASEIGLLLGTSSYSEFLLQSEYLYRMSESDNTVLTQMEADEQAIAQMQIVIQDKMGELSVQKYDLDTKKYDLAVLKSEADAAVSVALAMEDIAQEERQGILDTLLQQQAEWGDLMGTGMIDYVGGYYTWPVPGFSGISSPYGPRTLYGAYNYHYGIDIAGSGIYGNTVIASNGGTVVRVRYYTTGYGYHVMVDHGGNQWTVYAHLSGINVVEGEPIVQGTPIGQVGSTGNSTGPHLHFEIRIDGLQVDPLPHLHNR